jgi:hypothetical protein
MPGNDIRAYGRAGMVHGSACGRLGPDGNGPTGGRAKDTPRNRDECGGTATSEHPDHTLVAAGSSRNIRPFFRRGGGQTGARLRSPAATICSAWTYVCDARPLRPDRQQGKFSSVVGLREDSALIRKVTQRAGSYGAYTSVGFDRTPGSKWMPPTARRKGLPPQLIGTISGWSHRGAALEVHLFVAGS